MGFLKPRAEHVPFIFRSREMVKTSFITYFSVISIPLGKIEITLIYTKF